MRGHLTQHTICYALVSVSTCFPGKMNHPKFLLNTTGHSDVSVEAHFSLVVAGASLRPGMGMPELRTIKLKYTLSVVRRGLSGKPFYRGTARKKFQKWAVFRDSASGCTKLTLAVVLLQKCSFLVTVGGAGSVALPRNEPQILCHPKIRTHPIPGWWGTPSSIGRLGARQKRSTSCITNTREEAIAFRLSSIWGIIIGRLR